MAIDPANRALFENLGLHFVRRDILFGVKISDELQDEALEWMAEQEQTLALRDARRFRWMIALTTLAAVAACAAAWPVVSGWWQSVVP
jgi:hypothetical protein